MNEAEKKMGNMSLWIVTIMVVSAVILINCISCSRTMPEGEKKDVVTIIEDAGEEILDAGVEHYTGFDPNIDLNGNDK